MDKCILLRNLYPLSFNLLKISNALSDSLFFTCPSNLMICWSFSFSFFFSLFLSLSRMPSDGGEGGDGIEEDGLGVLRDEERVEEHLHRCEHREREKSVSAK